MDISLFLDQIQASSRYENQIIHNEKIPAREALYAPLELKPQVKAALSGIGIENLYTHQVEAIEKVREGKDVVLCTTTASGKSLTYMIPIFETILNEPEATALYISPLNALVNDQLKSFLEFEAALKSGAGIARYTGALSEAEKRTVREGQTNVVLTNPEMIHMSFLAWHHLWRRFYSNLRFIVVDESHYYRGVIGSNMANLLRRLLRVAKYYGASPQFICCSATIGNPDDHTETLIGRKAAVVENNGSLQGSQQFVFWNPPLYINNKGCTLRRSSFSEASSLFAEAVQAGFQTLAFTRSRQGVERMYKHCRELLRRKNLSSAICSYRSGYFDREREEIEKKMNSGELRGVISTNALELGIDIGGLDVCILDGYPGTVMSARQQAGRAGRSGNESLVVLVAGTNALDQYYMRNPADFFARSSENAVLNPGNPYILAGHLLCAAKEIPLKTSDEKYFGQGYSRVVELLEIEGLLAGNDLKYSTDPFPYKHVSLRGIDNNTYSLLAFEGEKCFPIEKDIEETLAFRECHPGAVYMHRGEPYYINRIDHEKKEIHAVKTHDAYYTKPMIDSSVIVQETYAVKPLLHAPEVEVGLGEVEVTDRVIGYRKIQTQSNEIMSAHNLEMPSISLQTMAVWLKLPDRLQELVGEHKLDFAGGIHAIEHAMISMYPLHLLVDRSDVGGVSTPSHPDLGNKSGIFIYDGHRGGVGYAEKGYDLIEEVLDGTLKAIESCPCESGCPSCIQSPKCGNNNEPLDKHAAIMLLHEILGKAPYIPPERKEKHLSEVRRASRQAPEKRSTDDALSRVRRQLRRETIKQESPAGQDKKEKTFIVTDEKGRMIGVISAPAPEKAAAKTFHQKLRGEKEPTREKPLEIRVRDLGAGNDYNFQLWVEISENKGNEAVNGENGKKVVKKLIIRKVV
ncbi:DEAD/DEAH box helicase domain-containing protein [Methanosarcina thermophila]|jgi:DEAD/DEAH box helicase domain-containing protein|uniref:ATP-dependent helicase n=4 Tax=Methanosarcina thermophila TaxID=2210 RepID=A0A1I6Z0Y1_METTE|nr:DEAD/DEAH box helicase [Methanosarcina thermophila]AKB14717.1 putative ATP-dependent helicase [Methanosarcina thermophila CHTI-55]ALK06304.1 MAG: ATP-dependent helicase [Methanosarcina sp. 795]AKB12082.1 putative ATP-dependent helicase [Methanosarcina thermophila TM-1]NLU57372.1 DEAD/DEAH box helicase [Methanosarcina thermophila]SFT56334.1 DEAD/DEAH box helicase domain-containing protein [Methanosarcina thermophila]